MPTQSCVNLVCSLIQVRELKAKYPGTVLMIQSGYKMLFFDEDAKVCNTFP